MEMPRPAEREPGAYEFLGVRLHPVDVEAVHAYITRVIETDRKALVLNLNIHCVNLAQQYPWLAEFLSSAQMIFCDGDGVRWGLKLLGKEPPPKITYAKWMWQLGNLCRQKDFSFYFLGGSPGVAAEAARKMQERFPGLRIAGTRHGYFAKEGAETEAVIAEINACRPDILIVGFGMPVQEKWLKENWLKIDTHIFLTGGAVFDYVSGRLARAPEWMLRMNLEWLFRLCQEPKRLFKRYVIGNPLFFWYILKEKRKAS